MEYHRPALLTESLDGLDINPDGRYVDATFGGGGHSKAILEQLNSGRLLAFDQDPDAAGNALEDERFTLVQANFKYLKNYLRLHQAIPVDGILADLGVSFHQFDQPERGFSIRFDAELDMRMNPADTLTAKEVVNTWDEPQLTSILKRYGELRNARQVAQAMCNARASAPIETVFQLKEAIARTADRRKPQQFYAKVFQALRIEVNRELEALELFLEQCVDVIRPGGRLAIISYHSLEDRLVKSFLKTGKFEGELEKDFFGNPIRPFRPMNSKVVVPTEDEIAQNPRSRSAKLRIAIRTESEAEKHAK